MHQLQRSPLAEGLLWQVGSHPTQHERRTKMYFTDDSLFPENMQPLIITAAPFGGDRVPRH